MLCCLPGCCPQLWTHCSASSGPSAGVLLFKSSVTSCLKYIITLSLIKISKGNKHPMCVASIQFCLKKKKKNLSEGHSRKHSDYFVDKPLSFEHRGSVFHWLPRSATTSTNHLRLLLPPSSHGLAVIVRQFRHHMLRHWSLQKASGTKSELLTEASEVNADLSGDRPFCCSPLFNWHNDITLLHRQLLHLWCIKLPIIPQTLQEQTDFERQYISLQRD